MPNKLLSCTSLAIALFMVCLAACTNAERQRNDDLFRIACEDLRNSNENLMDVNNQILRGIDKKMDDPELNGYAKVWQPKALIVDKAANHVCSFIDSLKYVLKGKQTSADKLLNTKTKGAELYRKLKGYYRLILSDSALVNNDDYPRSFITAAKRFDSLTEKEFSKRFFTDINVQRAIATLTVIQNDIINMEYVTLYFCFKRSNPAYCRLGSSYRIIASASSTHVWAGEEVVITAGLSYADPKVAKPTISIGGKLAKVDDDGFAMVSIKAPPAFGKHKVLVQIEVTETRTGLKKTMNREVAYYVDSIPTKP